MNPVIPDVIIKSAARLGEAIEKLDMQGREAIQSLAPPDARACYDIVAKRPTCLPSRQQTLEPK
jgi:hypothetical protein